jgi:nicotinate-nucleotide adenylyltransferase
MMKRIGLLGGSFNPAHRGHLRLSVGAQEVLGLDEVWWIVAAGNPLKQQESLAPFEARLASARRTARKSRVRVSDFERTAGTRFTVDTVAALRRRHPRHRFIWLMGADIVPQLHRWKDWRRFAHAVPIAVVSRPGYDGAARAARAMGWLRKFVRPASQAKRWTEWSAPAITLLRLPPDPTSATRIRALNPDWHQQHDGSTHGTERRDMPSSSHRRPLARPD